MTVLIVLMIVWFHFGIFGAWVALQKGRSLAEGFILGILFAFLGIFLEALLPSKL